MCDQIKPQKTICSKDIKNFCCNKCKSKDIIKWGFRHNKEIKKQKYKCKNCNNYFVINDGFYHIHKRKQLVTICLDLYMNGMSLRKVRNHIRQFTAEGISHMQVWRWLIKYSLMMKEYTDNLNPILSKVYHADEIFIKCNKEQHYFWDMIDRDTRFLLATHYSKTRDSKSATKLFKKIKERPIRIFTDGLASYKIAYKKTYGRRRNYNYTHIPLKADVDKRNNIIERVQGTIRERVKVIRAFKKDYSAEAILNLFVIYYNYIRVHQGLGTTPAEKASINLNLKQNKWLSLIKLSQGG